jgi:hypothetical protein
MSTDPMTKQEFIELLQSVLKEKKKDIDEYDELYTKCVLGYDLSYIKQSYEENKLFSVKDENEEGSNHLKSVLTTLVNNYGKERIVKVLKDL